MMTTVSDDLTSIPNVGPAVARHSRIREAEAAHG